MIAITEEIFVLYSQIVSKYPILSIISPLYLKKTHERRRENWPSYRQNSSSITALENTTSWRWRGGFAVLEDKHTHTRWGRAMRHRGPPMEPGMLFLVE